MHDRNLYKIDHSAALRERIEFETTVLKVKAKSQLGYERSPETLLHRLHALRKRGNNEPASEKVSDFASLLREPAEVWPAPARPCAKRYAAGGDIGDEDHRELGVT